MNTNSATVRAWAFAGARRYAGLDRGSKDGAGYQASRRTFAGTTSRGHGGKTFRPGLALTRTRPGWWRILRLADADAQKFNVNLSAAIATCRAGDMPVFYQPWVQKSLPREMFWEASEQEQQVLGRYTRRVANHEGTGKNVEWQVIIIPTDAGGRWKTIPTFSVSIV